jgi:hypothetical protein
MGDDVQKPADLGLELQFLLGHGWHFRLIPPDRRI